MPKDFSKTSWHGVPRQELPWFPTVDAEACIGCELCYLTCGREVYEIDVSERGVRKARPERQYNCMVGCSTCAVVCPTQAISFPSRDLVWQAEREHKIFKLVHAEAQAKRDKLTAATDQQQAEALMAKVTNRASVLIAGGFGDKRFLMQLEALIQDRSYDIENLQFSVPTLKGLMANTPAHMRFELTSTEQAEVQPMLEELKQLVAANGLIWIEG